jgi:hypothetical protein
MRQFQAAWSEHAFPEACQHPMTGHLRRAYFVLDMASLMAI